MITGDGHGRGLHFHGRGGEQAAVADQYAPHPSPPGPRENDSVGGCGPQAVEETCPTIPHQTHQLWFVLIICNVTDLTQCLHIHLNV